MLGRDRVVRCSHLEEHPSILKQGGAGMVREKLLQQTGEFRGGEFRDFQRPTPSTYQPMRADNWVTCAVWWRPCQS